MPKHELETIEFSIKPVKSSALGTDYGVTEINGNYYWNLCCINDKCLDADGLLFEEFAEMLEKPGDYFPFCCSYCGVSGCDGIFAPIRCVHHGEEIVLIIREPLMDECHTCDNRVCDLGDSWMACEFRHTVYRAHRINKDQMRQALKTLYDSIEATRNEQISSPT